MRTRSDNSFMPRIGIAQIAIESKTCPSDLISMALTALVFLFNSCVLEEDEDHHYKIYFENHWDKSIRGSRGRFFRSLFV